MEGILRATTWFLMCFSFHNRELVWKGQAHGGNYAFSKSEYAFLSLGFRNPPRCMQLLGSVPEEGGHSTKPVRIQGASG